MTMERDLYQQIREDATPLTVTVDGKTYATQSLNPVEPPEKPRKTPRPKAVSSLDALCALVAQEAAVIYPESKLFLAVPSYDRVCVFTDIFRDSYERQELYSASTADFQGWDDSWFDYEQAVIALRSQFIANEGTEYLLGILSRMSRHASIDTDDNGMTQHTTVSCGVTLVGAETIRPIVKLKPYRTFQEVDQPESEFLVRIREAKDGNKIGILGADGGMWKLAARNTIKEYLTQKLAGVQNLMITL
jgi:hypothetical protein